MRYIRVYSEIEYNDLHTFFKVSVVSTCCLELELNLQKQDVTKQKDQKTKIKIKPVFAMRY